MNGAELIFRHCLPHSLLTLIVLFILRRTHHQSSRTAYGICIILLLGLLIPVKIQLPVFFGNHRTGQVAAVGGSLDRIPEAGFFYYTDIGSVKSIRARNERNSDCYPFMAGWLRGSSGNKFDPQPGKSEMDPPLVKVGRA